MDLYLMCTTCGSEVLVSAAPSGVTPACPLCGTINAPPPQRLKTDSLLAGYQIIHRIEAHGAIETYLAKHLQNHHLVKLQTFSSPAFGSVIAAEYYLTAMRQWMQVRQTNIEKVFEAGRSGNGIYFAASDSTRRMTLEDRLWRGGAVELKAALSLALSISRILEWLWNEHGLIYGQLTPRHISLTPSRNITLAHMALSPILKTRPPGLSFNEFVTSTPGFTSPEQLSAPDHLDCRGDMYSLGATLYHMLTGKPPFACLNVGEVLAQQQAPSLADPRLLRPDLPDEWVWLLEILLAHDPKDRFDNWAALIQMLTALDVHKTQPLRKALKSHSVLIRLPPSDIAKLTSNTPRQPGQPLYPPSASPLPRRRNYSGLILGLIIVLGAILIVTLAVQRPRLVNSTAGPRPETPIQWGDQNGQQPDNLTSASKSAPFMSMLVTTRKFAREHPRQYEEILNRYEMLLAMAETNAPRWVPDLQRQVRAIEQAMAAPLDEAETAIRKQAREFEKRGEFEAGIEWLKTYTGPFTNKTRRLRQSLSNILQDQRKRQGAEHAAP